MPEINPSPKKKQPLLTSYGKYASMGFQMAAIIAAGTFGGIYLDNHFGFKKLPVFTLILSLSSIVLAIYFMVKDVINKK